MQLPIGEERDAAWEEINRTVTETAVWVTWSWDSETIFFSETLINPIYIEFFANIDWVNAGVAKE